MIRQMIAEDSGCCSYLVGSGKEFLLVDPLIDVERFTKSVQLGGGKIVGVIDTHVHADHLSGSREIQKLAGCPIYMHETMPGQISVRTARRERLPYGGSEDSCPSYAGARY